jgi:hypothetical protein
VLSIYIAKYKINLKKVLPSRERCLALGAPVFSVTGVQLDVAVPAALVLEETRAEFAAERHVLRVALQQTKRIDYYSLSLHECRGCNLRAMIAGLAQTQIIIISYCCCHRSRSVIIYRFIYCNKRQHASKELGAQEHNLL